MLGIRLVEAARSTEGQAVLRKEHRPRDVRDPHHQVIEQPVELAHRVSLASFHPLRLPCSVASVTGPAASRAASRTACCACPRAMPRLPGEHWPPARSPRPLPRQARSCGARLAWRTRRGSPLNSASSWPVRLACGELPSCPHCSRSRRRPYARRLPDDGPVAREPSDGGVRGCTGRAGPQAVVGGGRRAGAGRRRAAGAPRRCAVRAPERCEGAPAGPGSAATAGTSQPSCQATAAPVRGAPRAAPRRRPPGPLPPRHGRAEARRPGRRSAPRRRPRPGRSAALAAGAWAGRPAPGARRCRSPGRVAGQRRSRRCAGAARVPGSRVPPGPVPSSARWRDPVPNGAGAVVGPGSCAGAGPAARARCPRASRPCRARRPGRRPGRRGKRRPARCGNRWAGRARRGRAPPAVIAAGPSSTISAAGSGRPPWCRRRATGGA